MQGEGKVKNTCGWNLPLNVTMLGKLERVVETILGESWVEINRDRHKDIGNNNTIVHFMANFSYITINEKKWKTYENDKVHQ